MKYARYLAALLVFAFILTIPVASAEHATHDVDAGSTYTVEVNMAKGHTLAAVYESNMTLTFMVVDPNGHIVKNMTGTVGGYMIEANMDGNYRLVWQSYNQAPASLNYDFYSDVNAIAGQFMLMVLLGLVVLVAVVIIIVLMVRRKK